MKENPFVFGRVVEGDNFTNRRVEIERIQNNVRAGVNTVLISPRRWGKTSLVKKVIERFTDENKYKFCNVDLFKIRNEKDFYNTLSKNLIKVSSNKFEEWTKNALELLSRFRPKITVGSDPSNDFEISLNIDEKNTDYSDILDLSENLSIKKRIKIIVCIDEFQNLSEFDESLKFQKKMRSIWQHHKNTVYCLYGSKRHMMTEIFTDQSMPFYKFGDVVFLEKILLQELKGFIKNKFEITDKKIEDHLSEKIINLMECHPYYTQQLSFVVWNNTLKSVDEQIIQKSVEDLLFQNSFLFENIFERLSDKQLQFLKTLIDGVESGFSSLGVITKYNLGSSANVNRIVKSLEEREIINKHLGKIEFLDPAFKLWLKMILSNK
jgi:hypothetical protein